MTGGSSQVATPRGCRSRSYVNAGYLAGLSVSIASRNLTAHDEGGSHVLGDVLLRLAGPLPGEKQRSPTRARVSKALSHV